jgi:hypothetical protein
MRPPTGRLMFFAPFGTKTSAISDAAVDESRRGADPIGVKRSGSGADGRRQSRTDSRSRSSGGDGRGGDGGNGEATMPTTAAMPTMTAARPSRPCRLHRAQRKAWLLAPFEIRVRIGCWSRIVCATTRDQFSDRTARKIGPQQISLISFANDARSVDGLRAQYHSQPNPHCGGTGRKNSGPGE